MRETDENFYLGVSYPYAINETKYRQLLGLSEKATVFALEESGSQVFVFPKENFDLGDAVDSSSALSEGDLFSERIITFAQRHLGSVAIDPEIAKVGEKIEPNPYVQL